LAVRIETSAPTRIDLAGGTIDIWPLYLFHPGAQTINAAISLRAHARVETRADDRIVIRSEDTDTTVEADDWTALRTEPRLRLLSLLAHFFEARGITLTTSCQSPAGAGIAGSSALNVAVCAALAEWRREHYEPEALLQIAMNVEAQAINVPTGLQDYRPALYGGIAAVELDVDGVRRVPLDVDLASLQQRVVLCYTGEPRNSGTNNWEITKRHIDGDPFIFDCFERIRDTASAMRDALARASGRTGSGWRRASRRPRSTCCWLARQPPAPPPARCAAREAAGACSATGRRTASTRSGPRWPTAAPASSTTGSSATG
jgi:D-glycero-alpha-D-manno-heptose-7-phosphate kinase